MGKTSFDSGMDSGSPVIDEYDAKMLFKFTGTLQKLVIKIHPDELSAKDRNEADRLMREKAMARQ